MTPEVSVLFEDVDHAEAVCRLPDGRLAFGGEAGQVCVGDPGTGVWREVGSTGGRVLGVAVDAQGWIYACDPKRHAIYRVVEGGPCELVTAGPDEHPLRHPNSLAFLADGSFLASDSGTWGANDGTVIRHSSAGETTLASREFAAFPNGLALSPDSTYLYVAESLFGVSRATVTADGLGDREEVLAMPGKVPDGLAFTSDGGLLVACYQPNEIWHLSADGALSLLLSDPLGIDLTLPTNIAFFGDRLQELAIANLGARTLVTSRVAMTGSTVTVPQAPTTQGSVL